MNTTTSERGKETGGANGRGRLAAILVCFAAMGWLIGRSYSESVFHQVLIVVLGTAVGFAGIFLYTRVIFIFNARVQKQHGSSAIKQTVLTGFLMLVPFTVLATLAEIWFSWNAVIAFVSAGIMLSGVAVGAELVKLGKQKKLLALIPSLGAVIFAGVWIVLLSLVEKILATVTD